MKLEWTERAIEKIKGKIQHGGRILLKYDTEGCGCVVSGVSALWIVEHEPEGTVQLETNFLPVYIEKDNAVFFDEQMTIDFKKEQHTFQLKSPNQMLNPHLRLEN
ncbi:iron-sulfur cluster biosynthesis family protein [Fictibacillus sp. NRS-1165]|uniref:iron-sulfur cluster biosynthesis family protein n=1 Tax=Fictibacillus sp. NRS-1165 TaxID=3144463 RepID=UPI003D2204CD